MYFLHLINGLLFFLFLYLLISYLPSLFIGKSRDVSAAYKESLSVLLDKLLPLTVFFLFLLLLLSRTLLASVFGPMPRFPVSIFLTFWIFVAGAFLQFKYKMVRAPVFLNSFAILILLFTIFSTRLAGVHFSELLTRSILYSHIVSSVAVQIISVVAVAISIVYLQTYKNLKSKNLKKIGKAPSIGLMQAMLNYLYYFAFLFSSMALMSGAIMAQSLSQGQNFAIGWKFFWALAVWVFYNTILYLRLYSEMATRKLAKSSFFGILLLIVIFYVLRSLIGAASP